MSRRRVVCAAVTLAWLSVLCSTLASAHDVGTTRFDAPIPLWLLFAGAGATVGVTALLLGVVSEPTTGAHRTRPVGTAGACSASASGTTEATDGEHESTGVARNAHESAAVGRVVATISPGVARSVRLVARLSFLAFFLTAIGLGLFGTQAAGESLTTTFVWPVWIKGVGLYAIAFTSPWRTLSPWRTCYDGLCRLDESEIALFEYPPWLGRWPALFGFVLLVGILEALTIVPRSPRMTAAVVAGYAALMLGGAVAFGPTWFERADAFAVLYALLGRIAPVSPVRTAAGGYRIALHAPWRDCTKPVADSSLVAFAVATVYTVSFDGFTSTPEFQRLLFDARDALGLGGVVSVVLYLVGLVGFVALFLTVSRVMSAVAGSERETTGWRALALAFAPTVLPIAAAYELAHNYPYVLRNVGLLAAQLRSLLTGVPVGSFSVFDWLSVESFWYSQILLIVLGHVIAVVAAHRVALARSETLGGARRLHAPLVLLMIGYTVLSLWIISRPVVAG